MKLKQCSHAIAAGLVVGLLVTLAPGLHAQSSAFAGTWKRNLAKSSYDPGPPPKSDDRVYEVWEGDGLKATYARVDADGTQAAITFAAHFDGKDYKYTGSASRDTISLRRLDPNSFEAVLKKGGKVMITVSQVVSNGGKVLTQTSGGGIGADGKKVNKNVVVWDKQ